jgi:[ribosomal protein S5]-alanine N-acetyltransferase
MLPTLDTPRLRLRPATIGDLATLQSLWNNPDVRRYLFDDEPVSLETAEGILRASLDVVPRGMGLWLTAERDDAAVLGCAALLPVSTAADFEPRLAGMVEPLVANLPSAWRRGFATEALTALVEYAAQTLRLDALAGVHDVPNIASARMLARAGFTELSEVPGPRYRLRTYVRALTTGA